MCGNAEQNCVATYGSAAVGCRVPTGAATGFPVWTSFSSAAGAIRCAWSWSLRTSSSQPEPGLPKTGPSTWRLPAGLSATPPSESTGSGCWQTLVPFQSGSSSAASHESRTALPVTDPAIVAAFLVGATSVQRPFLATSLAVQTIFHETL